MTRVLRPTRFESGEPPEACQNCFPTEENSWIFPFKFLHQSWNEVHVGSQFELYSHSVFISNLFYCVLPSSSFGVAALRSEQSEFPLVLMCLQLASVSHMLTPHGLFHSICLRRSSFTCPVVWVCDSSARLPAFSVSTFCQALSVILFQDVRLGANAAF